MRRSFQSIVFTLLACPVVLCAQFQPGQAQDPLPDRDSFLTEAKSKMLMNQALLRKYTYQQKSIQKHLDKNGAVKKVETKLYEVFPESETAMTYRRLVEENGKAVPEKELRKQDREYEKKRADWEKKQSKTRQQERERAEREDREAIEDAFRMFDIAMEERESVGGRSAIRFSFKPRPGAKPVNGDGKILRNFSGRVWFDEATRELARLEIEAVKDVSIGLGLVARLRKGAHGVIERKLLNNEVWLPSRTQFTGNLRVLLLKSMNMEVSDEFFDYRKFSVETSVTYPTGK